MALWLISIVLAYLFFSLSFFGDKFLLNGPPNPKLYTLYVGLLNGLAVFFIPFTQLTSYSWLALPWAVLTGVVSIAGLYAMFVAVEKFEVSRVMPSIGALQPLFILLCTGLFWGFSALTGMNFLAFALLCVGSVVISFEKKLIISLNYIVLTVLASVMFSLAYVFSKFVFLYQPFLPGLVVIAAATFLCGFSLLVDRELRHQLFFKKNISLDKKTGVIFLFTQSVGGGANFLQGLAISLVPVSSLPVVNSLRGIQYVFLFLITAFFSTYFPHILKEDVSTRVIIQKIFATMLIVAGLALLVV